MRRSFISLLIGIALASIAVFLVSRYKNSSLSAPSTSKNVETVQVVVAAEDLPFGTKVTRDNLTYAEWPQNSLSKESFTDMKTLLEDEEGNSADRVVIRQIYKDEPILKKKVSGFGNKPTLSRKVSENKRAFTISINAVRGVAGFLLPGDKVDVLLTRPNEDSRGNNDLVTDVILQNVTVLGIDQLIDEGAEKPKVSKTATLEVDAAQAQKLALAQEIGTLSLTLRNYSDANEVSTGRVSVGDLVVGGTKKKKTEAGAIIKVRRGMALDYTRIY